MKCRSPCDEHSMPWPTAKLSKQIMQSLRQPQHKKSWPSAGAPSLGLNLLLPQAPHERWIWSLTTQRGMTAPGCQ
eukprot:scaffold63219_cov33-Tisochrysis_lutea.AAC.2